MPSAPLTQRSPSSLTRKYVLLSGLFILIVLGWTGYWFVAKNTLIATLDDLKDQTMDRPWSVSWENLNVSGFPFQLRVTADSTVVDHPESNISCDIAALAVLAQPWSMKHLLVNWDTQAVCNIDAIAPMRIEAASGRASVVFSPKVQVPRIVSEVPNISFTMPDTRMPGTIKAEGAVLSLDPVQPQTFEAGLRVDKLEGIPVPLLDPLVLTDIQAAAALTHVSSDTGLKRDITIRDLSFTFAETRLILNGAVTIDPEGYQTGEITIKTADFITLKETLKAQNGSLETPLELAHMMFTNRETGTTQVTAKLTKGQVSVAGFDLFMLPPWTQTP